MMSHLPILLAPLLGEGADRKFTEADIMLWCGILMGAVLVGSFVIMMVRRRWQNPGTETPQDVGFSLADLRAMRDRGEITSEEYEQTRAKVIAKVKQSVAESKPKPQDTGDQSPTDVA